MRANSGTPLRHRRREEQGHPRIITVWNLDASNTGGKPREWHPTSLGFPQHAEEAACQWHPSEVVWADAEARDYGSGLSFYVVHGITHWAKLPASPTSGQGIRETRSVSGPAKTTKESVLPSTGLTRWPSVVTRVANRSSPCSTPNMLLISLSITHSITVNSLPSSVRTLKRALSCLVMEVSLRANSW